MAPGRTGVKALSDRSGCSLALRVPCTLRSFVILSIREARGCAGHIVNSHAWLCGNLYDLSIRARGAAESCTICLIGHFVHLVRIFAADLSGSAGFHARSPHGPLPTRHPLPFAFRPRRAFGHIGRLRRAGIEQNQWVSSTVPSGTAHMVHYGKSHIVQYQWVSGFVLPGKGGTDCIPALSAHCVAPVGRAAGRLPGCSAMACGLLCECPSHP